MTRAQTATTELLRSSRRVDWRVLLEDPLPQRTAIHGDDGSLAASMTALGTRIVPIPAADVIVARNPSPAHVSHLAHAAAPRAAIVIELDRGPRFPGQLRRIEHALRSRGRSAVSLVAWPAVEESRQLVPLQSETLGWWISHLGRRPRFAGAMSALGVPAAMTALPIVVVANPASARSALFSLGADTDLDAARPWILLTPRYRASRHVVLLGNLRDGGAQIVVKAARLHGDASTTREAGVLAALTAVPEIDRKSIPSVLQGPDVNAPLTGFAMAGIDGERIGRARMRTDPRVVDLVRGWLRSLVSDTETTSGIDASLTVGPIGTLETAAHDHGGLSGRVLAALTALSGATLPRTIEHGDVGEPNLLQRPDDGLAVIDWETGRTDGLPLVDLIFALAGIAAARLKAEDPQEHADAVGAALGSGGWARPIIDEEARRLGLPPDLVPALIVACWARQLTSMAERQAAVEPLASAAEAAHVLRHRYRLILEQSLAAMGIGR